MRIPRNETDREDYHHMHGRYLKHRFIRQVSVGVVSAVGGLLLGLILGVIITICYLRRCKATHRKALRPKRGSYRVSSVESISGINNRTYIYGMETGSAIYGTAATYLSEEDRKKLGMGKVVINVSTQTDPMRRSKTELPTRSKRIEDKVYDYCCSNDVPGQTYVVYQNVFQTHMSARRPSSACAEEENYESPTWDPPKINMFHCNDETFTDDVFQGECKMATDDADDEDYIDPRLVNPKKKSTNTTKGRRPQKSKTSSSDSESDEKEMVDIQLKEYAHSLRVKRKTKRRDCRESVHWSPKKKSVTNGRQKSAKKGREKSGYMKMHLTPEMWEILKNHTDKMKAAKEAQASGSLSDEIRPRCSRGQLTRQQSVSNDEIYIDVIG